MTETTNDPTDDKVLPIWSWQEPPGGWVEMGEGRAEDVERRYRTAHEHGLHGVAWLRLPRGRTPTGTPFELRVPVTLDTSRDAPVTFENCTISGDVPPELPKAWRELIEALTILAKASVNDERPLNCSHDALGVCADPGRISATDLARLIEIGFDVDEEGGFYSFRYGSA